MKTNMKTKESYMTKNISEATAVTHAGVFHADEVFATVILDRALGGVKVLRTFRVPEDLPEDVIVYDIGHGKFDHHQKGGNGVRENGVPYSSCGLIWKEYGHKVVEEAETPNPELVWSLIDRDLIQGIDALDNGVMPKADYPAQALSISGIISQCNPNWDEEDLNADEAFEYACELADTVFTNILVNAISKANAQTLVDEAIEKSENGIMNLERFVPWQEFLFASELPKSEEILFVVFPSNRGGINCQCVPDSLGGFGQRKPLPEEWRGLPAEKLREVTGVESAIFCHPAGFMCSAGTREDAIKMAELAMMR